MAGFHCVVAIRTRKLFEGEIQYANVPGLDGMFGVLPGHELIVSLNRRGGVLTLNLDESGTKQQKFLLYDGATQYMNGVLTVLGEFAIDVAEIDRQKAEADAADTRKRIEDLEAQDELSNQDEARLRVYRHRLRWNEFQLNYLATGAVA